jgi:hypothetical protein
MRMLALQIVRIIGYLSAFLFFAASLGQLDGEDRSYGAFGICVFVGLLCVVIIVLSTGSIRQIRRDTQGSTEGKGADLLALLIIVEKDTDGEGLPDTEIDSIFKVGNVGSCYEVDIYRAREMLPNFNVTSYPTFIIAEDTDEGTDDFVRVMLQNSLVTSADVYDILKFLKDEKVKQEQQMRSISNRRN